MSLTVHWLSVQALCASIALFLAAVTFCFVTLLLDAISTPRSHPEEQDS